MRSFIGRGYRKSRLARAYSVNLQRSQLGRPDEPSRCCAARLRARHHLGRAADGDVAEKLQPVGGATCGPKVRSIVAPFHCPMPPVLPTERIAHLGTVDCCIPSTWAVRDDRGHAADNFFQGGSAKQATPLTAPATSLTTKNRFTPSFRG